MSVAGSDAPRLDWRSNGDLRWLEARLGGARAMFTTRGGGVSRGPLRSLNLGPLTDDEPGNVSRNRALALQAVARDAATAAFARQVHGNGVVRATRPSTDLEISADGQWTTEPAVTVCVVVADCYPIALSLPGAVAMIHCGWRGTAAGILGNAVRSLTEQTGGSGDHIQAAIGPGIGSCCYEVGAEVHEAFGIDASATCGFDLAGQIEQQLSMLGIGPDRVATAGVCTHCDAADFFSHRRDGPETGRQAGFAWLA